ncbi:butyrophilin subfamily 1 member A1-like isoform X1 [Anas platyrhynchos]|uniref:butyrophilin subfamily 1 member A1-like isoform X1 n=1 Tax=Anas platyrhynchos TaxID=8839 RepID=UPI003AF2F8A3
MAGCCEGPRSFVGVPLEKNTWGGHLPPGKPLSPMGLPWDCGCPSLTRHARRLLTSLITLLLLQLGSAQLRVEGPGHPLTATVGQDVVLPCHLSPQRDARSLDVRWIRDQISETVHHYRNGEDLYGEQMGAYAGRTELVRDGLSAGSLDLRITGLRPSDDGQYFCTVGDADAYAEAIVDLEVSEKQAAELAWRKFLLPHYKVKVTLDPDMAHHMYVLSQDNSRVRLESERHQDPDTRKTFDDRCCVLGREEFREGRHCWLVEVEGEQIKDSVWAVGVIKASMERTKGTKFFGDKWAVQYSKGQLESLTYPSTPLSLSPVPTRIWICLDCTQEQVSFFNADNGVQIYTSAVSFNGESLRPWFWIRTLGIQLCLRDSTPQTPSPALGSSCPCPATPASPLLGPAGAAQK